VLSSGPKDVFAVGENGTILHYDGKGWTTQPCETNELLNGDWGNGPKDVFAVGTEGTVLHYDGQVWSPRNSGNKKRPQLRLGQRF